MMKIKDRESAGKLVGGTVKATAATVTAAWYLFTDHAQVTFTGRLADAAETVAWFLMIVGPLALLLLAAETVTWIKDERDR